MFKIGDQVAHYKEGVCEVVAIGTLSMSCSEKDKEYYTLKPIYNTSGTLYIPVECGPKQLRKLISEDEAKELLEEMPAIETLEVQIEKKREPTYKEALLKNECTSWVSLIKTTYLRKKARLEKGKKVINVDERYLNNAEKFLYGEVAVALDMPRDSVKAFLITKMQLD